MNGVLLVNKEEGRTSRDIVNDCMHIFNTKKIGHTGTLDPLATGVLVITIGRYTKLGDALTSTYKEYIAEFKLGIETDTLDITGNILETKKVPKLTKEDIKEVLNSFLGTSIQETPIYSAVKVNGKKLYEYAREGIDVELPKREINIKEIELISYDKDEIVFKTTVSKGTYIRALINDICTKLNTVGTMSNLVRTKQGDFSIEESYTIEDIENNNYKLLTVEEILASLEQIDIKEDLIDIVSNGGVINKIFKNDIACLRYNNKTIAIYKTYEKDKGKAKPYIML